MTVELVTLGLVDVLLLLEFTLKGLTEEALVALEHFVEGVGRLGKGVTELIEKSTELSAKGRAVGTLVTSELIHDSIDLRGGETCRRLISRTVHGLELHLDAAKKRGEIALFGNLASLLAATVLLEVSHHAADALIVTALRGLAVLGVALTDPLDESLGALLIVVDHVLDGLHEVDELADTLTSHLDLVVLREDLVEGSTIGHDRTLIRTRKRKHILGIEKLRDAKVLLGNVEGEVEVLTRIFLAEGVVVKKIGTVLVDESAEGKTILEAVLEVLNIDILVALGLLLAPEEKTLLGAETFLRKIADGETKDDGPDHTKSKSDVTITDILSTDGNKVHTTLLDESKSLVKVLDHLKTHARIFVVLTKGSLTDNFKEFDEFYTILEASGDILNAITALLCKMHVTPLGESLDLHLLPTLSNFFRHLCLLSIKKKELICNKSNKQI